MQCHASRIHGAPLRFDLDVDELARAVFRRSAVLFTHLIEIVIQIPCSQQLSPLFSPPEIPNLSPAMCE